MRKKVAFTLVEVLLVLGLILLTASVLIPNLIEDNKKLDIISKWKNSYRNIEYIFTAIKTQMSETDIVAFKKASSAKEKEDLFIELMTPYFRLTDPVEKGSYKLTYLNGTLVKEKEDYFISNLYNTNNGNIVGLKWLNTPENLSDKIPIAILLYDLNGAYAPNRWGQDVFAINIFRNRIEPLGKIEDESLLKKDCSKNGTGVTCSYYYHIYGGQQSN